MFWFNLLIFQGSAQKRFELDPISGNLSVKSELDRETESQYSFQVNFKKSIFILA